MTIILVDGSSMLEPVTEVRYSDCDTEDHYYNLTAPIVAFDRLQQRRKSLAKQHFVKQAKKPKIREQRFMKVTWR